MTSPIAQVARMSGVTSRTLRHYDQTGLLPAARIGANGYRYYGQAQLLLLQQILVLRVLGLSLPDIGAVLAEQTDTVTALHAAEARERWGDAAVDQATRRAGSAADIERSQHELTALIHRMAALLAEGAAAGDPRVLDTVAEHYRWVSGYWTPNRDSYPASPRCTSTTSGSRPATRRCGRAGCLHPRCDGGACPAGGSADPPAARPGERTCRGRRPPAWPH
jgi:DNA-binding transcriptional MerR regulator